jgi:hypothetical protein
MKWGITVLGSFAFGDLFRVVHIHGIGETVVGLAQLRASIPEIWFKLRFPA